ncbi:class I SAM-dependent methyltransferase [Kineococcus rhizosphaerae]|uniref:16S rRNA m(2)G 1207 methyltransferase n=1 Tax=Kineococcus rhizosphaerae TaxID=559628 RepID=A0A2T0RBE9_9ACTN|nr:methyltransferase [Kineococcus rhizosphaerae]PRY18479.1 16S rRNA m(2)G 1207 methyltransferase [Kineococcus rhizosphaerae]
MSQPGPRPDPQPESQHYFTAAPATPDERRELTVELAGRPVTVTTARGVFSGDRLDKGTAVLLPLVEPDEATGDVLDLGCGWGPIALTLALLRPHQRVHAVDVNERALDLLRRNASRLGLTVRASLPDDVDPDLVFAEIWSNPPIRIGKEALHELLLRWLPRLAPGGVAHLVVQKNLGSDSLHAWLGSGVLPGTTTTRTTTSKGFRVLSVRRAA